MTRLLIALIGMVLMAGCELKAPVQKPAVHAEPTMTPAAVTPDKRMQLPAGGEGAFTLSALKGRVVLLEVCAPWSSASQAQVDELNQLVQREATAGLKVIGLVVDAVAAGQAAPRNCRAGVPTIRWWRRRSAQWRRFGQVRSVPTRILVDRKGQIRKHYAGIVAPEVMQQDVLALLKEP